MKTIVAAVVMSMTLGLVPLLAQEKREVPMKGEGTEGSGMMMGKMKEMQGKITALNPSVREMSVQVNKDTISFVADTSLHNYGRLKVGEQVVMRYTQGMIVAVSK